MCVIDMLLSLFLKENMFRKKKNNLSQNGSGKGKRPMGGGSVALRRRVFGFGSLGRWSLAACMSLSTCVLATTEHRHNLCGGLYLCFVDFRRHQR